MKTTRTALLQLDAACMRLGRREFGPFSLNIDQGERIAILGPSGAGKSTLLRLMASELACIRGSALLDERSLASWTLAELSRRRAVLPQSMEVAFGLETDLIIGLGRVACRHDPQLDDIVRQAATHAHAAHLLGRRFDTLSGGEKARVQLARVFAQLWDRQDGLILVDEPLAALDPGLQFELLDELEGFAAQRGHAIVAVLHDINHALQGFDRLLLIQQGELVGDLPADARALPHLEALYGVALTSLESPDGNLVVMPTRRTARNTANG
ncbi:ATP-binding cassette domain-containing protein [Uliginosibacterium sp. H3]|uniref:ATP-binding cassette domain-containing protein n=1 Tax=Uliginosibacterium silvisoli TaxID=3114758 RepID=A0ABU6K0I7_9RHOO|nr:ATP-binding cassette domain-containing protein [Uliginosibacterium sp. H3]